MIKTIDNLLNRITMYRLVLYYLIFLLGAAIFFSFTRVLAYNPYAILFSTAFIVAVCAITNWVFSRTFGAPTNVESVYISALILALIITPIQSYSDLWFLGWASILSMASKYIVAIRGKHLFNPAAFAVALTYFTINQSASWWIGDATLLPFVLLGGLLVVRKLGRFDLVLSFLLTSAAAILVSSLFSGVDLGQTVQGVVLYSPFFFFAFIMLTEPMTTPPTRKLRMIYGAIVGFFFTPLFHIGSLFTTPELALLIGNVYSYLVSPKIRLVLRLKDRVRIAPDTYEFIFAPSRKLAYAAGQYMEWTLGHEDSDSRGNRRYFTLASAPTEDDLKLGIRFSKKSSSFKKAMLEMDDDEEIVASQLAGDFVLPQNPRQKCIFIAGGIGVTPFRSMIQYLLSIHQRRPITLFYANKTAADVVYKDIFDQAEKELGIKTVYTVTDQRNLPAGWQGKIGRITPNWIKRYVPDYKSCVFYLSGPIAMVNSFKDALHALGVRPSQIKIDFFPGL